MAQASHNQAVVHQEVATWHPFNVTTQRMALKAPESPRRYSIMFRLKKRKKLYGDCAEAKIKAFINSRECEESNRKNLLLP